MSNTPPETQGQSDNINPAWKSLLDKLPAPMQQVILPDLKAWDQNFQTKLQEVREEFEPLKKFKDLDPQVIDQSLYLYKEFSERPQEVIAEAIKAYELPYVDSNTIQQPNPDDNDEYEEYDGVDITQNPQFRELAQQLEQLQEGLSEREKADLNAQYVKQHEEWLAEMQSEEKYGSFDTEYVTALMSQGVDGEEAIKRYQSKFANSVTPPVQQNEVAPPVVMGGDGTTGSGLPEQGIDFAKMSKSDFNDSVLAMLQADAANNNQG